MSLTAVIGAGANITSWSRAILCLATVLDQMAIQPSNDGLKISAVNTSRTTRGEINLRRDYFKELQFRDDEAIQQAHAFLVNSRHLSTLFKGCDGSSHSYILLRVDWDNETLLVTRRFKLFIEMMTKNMIVRKFQLGYQPIERTDWDLGKTYRADPETESTYQFEIATSIWKSFLDMVPVSTEDFSIDHKGNKILFGAFTKQVVKDRDILRQPMLLSVLMPVDELPDSNFKLNQSSLYFRLKDFRNFVTLCTCMRTQAGDDIVVDSDPRVSVYFKELGNPIVFEFAMTLFALSYVQVTSGGDAPSSPTKDYQIPVPVHVKDNIEAFSSRGNSNGPDTLRSSISGAQPGWPELAKFSSSSEKRNSKAKEISRKRQQSERDTDYTTSEGEEEFGPTQHASKPLSIFD